MEEKKKVFKYSEQCIECGSNLVPSGGEFVCSDCGLVDSPVFDSGSQYDRAGNIIKSLNSYRVHDKLLGSYIDLRKSPPDLYKAIVNTRKRSRLRELLIISERISSNLRLSPIIKERVGYLIHGLAKEQVKRRLLEITVAACAYIACEESQIYRSLTFYKDYCNGDYNGFFKIVREIKQKFNIKTKRFPPEMYVPFICEKLDLSNDILIESEGFIRKCMTYRHNPRSWASAAVFIVAKMNGIIINKQELCKTVGISDTCLNERIKEMVDEYE